MPKCKSCGCEILWLKHTTTGKVSPIEAEKVADGNIVVDLNNGLYRIATGDEWGKARVKGIRLHISHFARCNQASSFRNK